MYLCVYCLYLHKLILRQIVKVLWKTLKIIYFFCKQNFNPILTTFLRTLFWGCRSNPNPPVKFPIERSVYSAFVIAAKYKSTRKAFYGVGVQEKKPEL
jgi:hypothetical protein